MKFFQDSEGGLWPVDKIEHVWTTSVREIRHFARLSDGAEIELQAGEFENLRRIGAPIFAAAADHYVIHLDFDRVGNDPVIKIPIIGWINDPDHELLPITGDGVNDGAAVGECQHIMYPDGSVKRYYDEIFATVDEFIENERKR